MARIYKEGQGKWSRSVLVVVVLLSAIFALKQFHGALPSDRDLKVILPLIGFALDYRFLIHGPLLIGAAVFAFWLFNRPATVDFLIETESELKNKVTWPSRKEEVNSSIVVVITVLIVGLFIFGWDLLLKWLSDVWYGLF
jgi:preprotein translocase SecE subunit